AMMRRASTRRNRKAWGGGATPPPSSREASGRRGRLVFGLGLGARDVGDDILTVGLLLPEVGDDPPSAEDDDAVDQVEHLPHVVADQDQRLALFLQVADDVFH